MYQFYYDYLKPKCGDKWLLYLLTYLLTSCVTYVTLGFGLERQPDTITTYI